MTRRPAASSWMPLVACLSFGILVAGTAVEAQRWGRPRTPRSGACFYRNADFRGDYFCIAVGDEYDQMPEGLNDRVSSIRVFGDAEVIAYRNPNFRGRSERFAEDVENLQTEGWNDAMSSVQVRRVFRRMSRSEAEEIVRRAYRSVLGRDPDPGARGYVDHVMQDRWTQRDVERELRRSPEYRRKPPA
ncbi:MAG: peptidase inhibitor family I36 protein [Vicinamibacterales bacterium]